MSTVTLITGTSTGFGRLLAEMLAREGQTVFATMRDAHGRNAPAAQELGGIPGIRVLDLDVTNEESVLSAVHSALTASGRIDCVVNNAGFGNFGLTESFTAEQWQFLFNTNLLGCIRVNRAVLPSMRKQGSGLLVHLSSIAGRIPVPYLGPYSASKWAVEAYAEVLRLELAPLGIDSIVIEPGKYPTEIFGKRFNGADPAPAAEYGEADLSRTFLSNFMAGLEVLNQDPAEVAQAIRDLMAMPMGSRPFRTPVGLDATWLAPYNEAAEQIREQVKNEYLRPPASITGA